MQLLVTILNFIEVPYYNYSVDHAHINLNVCLSYVYILAVLKILLQLNTENSGSKVSFIVVFSVNFILLVLFFVRLRNRIIESKYLKQSSKSSNDYHMQLVHFVRKIAEGKP